jgi:hypothetical protein
VTEIAAAESSSAVGVSTIGAAVLHRRRDDATVCDGNLVQRSALCVDTFGAVELWLRVHRVGGVVSAIALRLEWIELDFARW